MTWKVFWLPNAEQELADVWLQATDRSSVSNAALAKDYSLSVDPENLGESRPNERRI